MTFCRASYLYRGGGATTNSGNLTKEVKDDSSAAASISHDEDSTTQDDYKESTTKSSTPQGNRLPQGILSQAGSESTTQPTQQPDSTLPSNDEAPPFEETPSQTPPPPSVTPEVFMQLDNSYHGGVVLKIQDQIQKVVGFDIVGENAEGKNKTLQMETLPGATVMGDVISLGKTSFQRHRTSELMPLSGNKGLPRPGLYASRLGDEASTGWFDDAAKKNQTWRLHW